MTVSMSTPYHSFSLVSQHNWTLMPIDTNMLADLNPKHGTHIQCLFLMSTNLGCVALLVCITAQWLITRFDQRMCLGSP